MRSVFGLPPPGRRLAFPPNDRFGGLCCIGLDSCAIPALEPHHVELTWLIQNRLAADIVLVFHSKTIINS
jgi:hypothetical protein